MRVSETVNAYEQLRRNALDPHHGSVGDLAMTLLLRRGLAAWAQQYAQTRPSHATRLSAEAPALNRAAQTQLTGLLVSMLIGSLERTEALLS